MATVVTYGDERVNIHEGTTLLYSALSFFRGRQSLVKNE